MLLADTTTRTLYGVAYSVQFVGALFTIRGLYILYKSSADDLHELWSYQPDPVLLLPARCIRRSVAIVQLIGLRVGKILHLRRPGTVVRPLTAKISAEAHMAGVLTSAFGDPPKYDPSEDIRVQLEALTGYVGLLQQYAQASRQAAQNDLSATRREIEDQASRRATEMENLTRKARQFALGGFGAAVFGTALLIVGICLELAANFS